MFPSRTQTENNAAHVEFASAHSARTVTTFCCKAWRSSKSTECHLTWYLTPHFATSSTHDWMENRVLSIIDPKFNRCTVKLQFCQWRWQFDHQFALTATWICTRIYLYIWKRYCYLVIIERVNSITLQCRVLKWSILALLILWVKFIIETVHRTNPKKLVRTNIEHLFHLQCRVVEFFVTEKVKT